VIAAAAIVVAGGAAIAIAAAGGGPVPPRATLAAALRRTVHGRPVAGVSARVTLTNNLIGSALLQGTDPLLSGASGRLWAANGQVRIELQGDNGDAQIVLGRGRFWIYDPTTNTVYSGSMPSALLGGPSARRAGAGAAGASGSGAGPTVSQIQSYLTTVAGGVRLSGATPGDVGGAPAYSMRMTPLSNSGLLSGVRLAWDAVHGIPLDVAMFAKGVAGPVLELKVTNISYGRLSPGDYEISPPPGATVVTLGTSSSNSSSGSGTMRTGARSRRQQQVTGVAAVSPRVKFGLDAPSSLAGMARTSVRLLGHGASASALVLFGHGLGTIAVSEQALAPAGSASAGGAGGLGGLAALGNLTLPTARVGDAIALELPTALGTLLHFTRGGVSYTLAGSVSPSVAIAAARGL
jgi:hypothetical protein